MAVTVTDLANGTSNSASGTLQTGLTVTATTADNDWLVVIVVYSTLDGIVDVTDTVGNTYTARVDITPGSGTTSLAVFTAPITTNITNGRITVDFTSTPGKKAMEVYRFRPSAGSTVSFITADTVGQGPSSVTNHAAATVSVTAGNTIFGVACVAGLDPITGDSDTSNGSWSTIVTRLASDGTASTARSCVSQYKTVTLTGNQSWAASTVSPHISLCSYLVLKGESAAFSLAAAQGQYTMTGAAATPKFGHVPIVAGAGSYALTGTDATFINTGTTKTIAAGVGSYSMAGVDATLVLGHKLDATTAGSYALTGTDATLRRALPMVAGSGSYAMVGTDVVLTKASLTNKVLTGDVGAYLLTGTDATVTIVAAKSVVAAAGSYVMAGTDVATTHQWKATVTDVGSYVLTGSDVALSTAANKVILALPGSYALTGTDVALTAGVAPPSVSPLHIGEWPRDAKKRRAREDAQAKEQRARKRFRDAIGRLLEGLPPEFDEPLDEALDNAVQASNLLYAMSAPIREINEVNVLIDHIRQLRIAQPIARLHLAQAYNQAHRHLAHKANEDAVMALLLGE